MMGTLLVVTLSLLAGSAMAQGQDQGTCMQDALRVHNELRAKHGAPPVEWDDALAAREKVWLVQNAGSQCGIGVHSPLDVKDINNRKAPTGQENLYGKGPTPASPCGDAVRSWYSEIKDYNFATGNSNGGAIGHFTQVVWKTTTKIGCYMLVDSSNCVTVGCAYDTGNSGNNRENVQPEGSPMFRVIPNTQFADKDAPECGSLFDTEWCRPGWTNGNQNNLEVLVTCPKMCAPVINDKRQAWIDAANAITDGPAPTFNNNNNNGGNNGGNNGDNGDMSNIPEGTTITNNADGSITTTTRINNPDGSWSWSSSTSFGSSKKLRLARRMM